MVDTQEQSGNRRTVLVVDDDPIALEVARERLERGGYDVILRDQSLGTTQWIVQHRPDIVLLDVMMPALSGTELARVVAERSPDTVVVLHSSKSQDELEAIGEHAHADGVLSKSLSEGALLSQLGRIYRRVVRESHLSPVESVRLGSR